MILQIFSNEIHLNRKFSECFFFLPLMLGHVASAREQLMLQTQKLASRRSEKPPKLPPRDNMYPHDIPKPDYDDINDDERLRAFRVKSDKGRDLNKKYGKSVGGSTQCIFFPPNVTCSIPIHVSMLMN